MEDDERPWDPLVSGPPTIEEQISPFHLDTSPGRTIQGMPAARFPEPKIATAPPVLTPPNVIHVPSAIPSSLDAVPPDGPTVPDGVPAILAGPRSDEQPLDEMATDPYAGQRVRGVVPHPDAPKIQISKSMEYDVAALGPLHDEEKTAAVRAPRYVAPPTEVVLPALSRAKKKQHEERSDAWLVLGLLFLVLVIVALIVAVVIGVVHRMG